jgi:hypothetical protein
MVPVLFMRAVMAAEQVGAGREELEDFDEAVDGEPVLMADPSPRATPRRWQATATIFFGRRTSGEAQAVALAPHRGCVDAARATDLGVDEVCALAGVGRQAGERGAAAARIDAAARRRAKHTAHYR